MTNSVRVVCKPAAPRVTNQSTPLVGQLGSYGPILGLAAAGAAIAVISSNGSTSGTN